jgi:hypothetical protein
MGFSQDAINALSERRIKPFARIETKMSSEQLSDPWHVIEFHVGSLIHDSNEFCACLKFKAIDRSSMAIDSFRSDDDPGNFLRTGSRIRLSIGLAYMHDGDEITESEYAFQGFISGIVPYVDKGIWGVEITAHDKMIRARNAVASVNEHADLNSVINELLTTTDHKTFLGLNSEWVSGMVTLRRTIGANTRQVPPDEFQVLEKTGGVEFFETQDISAQVHADYYWYNADTLHVSEVIKQALEYPSESGGLGLTSGDFDLVDTSSNNPEPKHRLPLLRFNWDETDGGPIEIYNHLLRNGLIPENLKFWYDSRDDKFKLQFVYQKDEDNPMTPGFDPDFELIRSISFDDPADSEELFTRTLVIGKLRAPRNLTREGGVVVYSLPPHPGFNAGFQAPEIVGEASNLATNVIDSNLNTQYMWILGDKVGEYKADGAIIDGTQDTSLPEFDSSHAYNEIAPLYIDLGSMVEPSRVVIHIGSNKLGTDRNPGKPQMLVSMQVAQTLDDPDDMDDPNWIPLSDSAYRQFVNANDCFDLSRDKFLVSEFRYIRVLFHFGLYYKWKPERRFIEYPIREIAVYEDDRVIGEDKVSLTRYPDLYERYENRGYRTFIQEDFSLQKQDDVDSRAKSILDELVRAYLDRETIAAWDPRFNLHAKSKVNGMTIYGLTVTETDPRYGIETSRLITRIEYDLQDFVVRFSGTNYFGEVG